MATVSKWTPFGVALDITATGSTVTRTSATKYTVKINASWETYYSGAKTNYGMTASSGGSSATINKFGTNTSSGSGSFTGTYSISGNGSATKTITVTFKNFNSDNGNSATKTVSFNVNVPAWTSYKVTYNANGGTSAPATQTKWKDQTLTLSSAIPKKTGYTFNYWYESNTSIPYSPGEKYTRNAALSLTAAWSANTYTVTYNANGGTGAPASQTKTHGTTLTLSSAKPTRTNYNFKGWGTSTSATTVSYAAGASYTQNAAITLYAIWELAYTKPRIENISIARCDSDGEISDEGRFISVNFDWAVDESKTVSEINIVWTREGGGYGTEIIPAAGKSGSISTVVGDGEISTDTTCEVTVTVADDYDYNDITRTVKSATFPIDFLAENKGVAIGKAAELENTADFAYETIHRQNAVFKNDKSIHGTMPDDKTTYIALIPVTASGNLALGHGLYKAKLGATNIYGNKVNFYTNEDVFMNGSEIVLDNTKSLVGLNSDGTRIGLISQSENNNTIVGFNNYANKSGNSHIYGHDIIYYVSNIAEPGSFRPYLRQGDSITLYVKTAGYVTNNGKEVYFTIPLSRPIVGSPTVTITSGDGLILRQGDKYTHGSGASTYVFPTEYAAVRNLNFGVAAVKAVFSNTTNVTNNDSIGIHWHGTITFT